MARLRQQDDSPHENPVLRAVRWVTRGGKRTGANAGDPESEAGEDQTGR